MYCYKTFHYKRYTKYKYILFITTLPYRGHFSVDKNIRVEVSVYTFLSLFSAV